MPLAEMAEFLQPPKRSCSPLTLPSSQCPSAAVAYLDGRIVRDLVSTDGKGFLTGLILCIGLAIPSIYTNFMAW